MKLRIHRSYEWRCTLPLSEIKFGGDNPLTLVATDVLEYLVEENGQEVWEPVPIFEDPIPEHPRDAKIRNDVNRFMEAIDIEALKKVIGDPMQSISGQPDSTVLLQNKEEK